MALLSVSAHDIDTAGLAVEIDLPPAWLAQELSDADLTAAAPGHFSGRLSRSSTDIVVRGRLRAELSTPCARCLQPTAISVDTELSLLLKPASAEGGAPARGGKKTTNGHAPPAKSAHKEPEEYEFQEGEADLDTYDGEAVVLDPFLREAILLEIPNFPLCSEACPGIRPAAGEPLPKPIVDPRLAPLGALREKLAAKRSGPAGPAGVASRPSRPPARSSEPQQAPKKKKNKE